MFKILILLFSLLMSTLSFSASEFDKDITVKDQTRNEKVTTVFKEMMRAYEEEDINEFFSYVSEDRFIQDYMTFYEAIEQDLRVYDILTIDTWVNKITDDGVKRYLYVRWEKRYESTSSNNEIVQLGYSRFLFDEVNGKYKLIELAGNNFWGISLPEWREEVPQIAGQEIYVNSNGNELSGASGGGLPDLTTACGIDWMIIYNIGTADTTAGSIDYESSLGNGTYSGDIPAGGNTGEMGGVYCPDSGSVSDYVTVNPANVIEESDYTNNTYPAP